MNRFVHTLNGFYTNDVYYTNSGSIIIEKKHWDKLDKTGLVGKNFSKRKNYYKDGGLFYALFLAPKIKYCLTINKHGINHENKTFQRFTNMSANSERKEFFKMLLVINW